MTIQEAAKEYAKGIDLVKGDESICISDAEAFEAGARWMREIILKEIEERRKSMYHETLEVSAAVQVLLSRIKKV